MQLKQQSYTENRIVAMCLNVWGALKSFWEIELGINVKNCLFEGVIVPTALYGQRHGVLELQRGKE